MNKDSGLFALKMLGGALITVIQVVLGFFGGPLIFLTVLVLPAPLLFLVVLLKRALWEKQWLRFYLVGATFASIIGSVFVVGYFFLHSS